MRNKPKKRNVSHRKLIISHRKLIISHSTEEIDNNNNNNKIDSLEPTIVFSERLEKLAQQFTFVGARFNSTIIDKEKKEEDWIAAANLTLISL